ncbi:hypothetical protein BC938DRAFT_481175 [Jimgerdemannia flammicorona]|uniref:Cyclin C-terminal domain-containing protein n=1 Tax=Jimgerdemannia flammicorona TaxID=994334 RepID=A0A433QGS8_9FUNG|nr:hypothetical protein BC938DRAFT_481175 [Jimgerdemannia flammicorona]
MDLYCDEMDLDPPLHHQDNRRFPLKNLSNAHRGHQHSKTNRKYTPYSTHTRADLQTSRYSDLCHHVSVEKQQGSSATIDNDFAGLARSSHVAETHSRRPRLVRPFEYNPWYWNEYAPDVYSHFRDLEKSHRPRTSYMSKQTEINSNMRAILIDWLVEVVLDLRLSEETFKLHRQVPILCPYHEIQPSMRWHRSLIRGKVVQIGQTPFIHSPPFSNSLSINYPFPIRNLLPSSKYEEVEPPFLSELADITDRTYTERQILAMEQKILKVLRFELTVVSVRSFAIYFVHASECDERMAAFVNYLSDLTLLDYAFLRFLPSEIAASAVVIALHTFRCTYWVRHSLFSPYQKLQIMSPRFSHLVPPPSLLFTPPDRSPRLANGLPARTPFQLCPEPVRPARQVLRVRARVRGRQGHALVARGETRVWVGCRQDAT